ncbi:hypothetical protein JCM3775_007146 [Rhodotorula graminis]
MPPPSKRARTRSPSPTLPLHLLTSLPSVHSLPPPSTDPALARLLPSVAHGVRAHEARLLDPHEWREVREANVRRADEDDDSGARHGREQGRRGGLVRWAGSTDGHEVWTDRYDILHLLPSFPPPPAPDAASSTSRGFDSLPSTHEESFYFTPAERTAIERKTRRRQLEDEREARVRAAAQRDEEERVAEEKRLAEETTSQLALMHRLHATLSSSPNPALLEMRVLANHGADARFAFLRPGARGGRWRETWERIRSGELRAEGEDEREKPVVKQEEKGGGMAGLAAYGSSDEDEGEGDDEATRADEQDVQSVPASLPEEEPGAGPSVVEEEESTEQERRRRQEQKAEKARAWAQKRREAREAQENEVQKKTNV